MLAHLRSQQFYVVCLLYVLLFSGCAPHYKYNEITYSNPTEALNAQKLHLSSLENSIPSTQESFGGTAKIVLPSLSTIKIQGVVRKNNPPEVMVDYIAQAGQESYMSMARVLKKQNLF